MQATKICREAKAAGGTWIEAASTSLITSYTDVAVLPVFSCNSVIGPTDTVMTHIYNGGSVADFFFAPLAPKTSPGDR